MDYCILLHWQYQCKYFSIQLCSMIYTDIHSATIKCHTNSYVHALQQSSFTHYQNSVLKNKHCVGATKSHADIYAGTRKPCEEIFNHLIVQPLWWYSVQNMEHMPNSWRQWCEQSKWKRLRLTLHYGVAVWWVVSKSASCCTLCRTKIHRSEIF
jgi:hypothetical protein